MDIFNFPFDEYKFKLLKCKMKKEIILLLDANKERSWRPITLNGTSVVGSRQKTLTTRNDIEIVQAWTSVLKLKMTLIHPKGKEYTVIFARPFITNLDGKKFRAVDQNCNDKLKINLHLITV